MDGKDGIGHSGPERPSTSSTRTRCMGSTDFQECLGGKAQHWFFKHHAGRYLKKIEKMEK